MTTGSTQRPERLTRNNALLLLVDHQVGLYTGIRDIDVLQLKHNVVGLTRAMLALKVPVIVTTTTEKMWGPLIPELAEVLPGVPGIERTSVNAWDEKRIVDAVKATGRKNLIITGISTDVCLTFPAIAALADGFQSYAVIDASGGFSQTQVDMGILRMQHARVIPVCYSNVAVEILADNAAPEAEAVYGALGMPFSGLVFGSSSIFREVDPKVGEVDLEKACDIQPREQNDANKTSIVFCHGLWADGGCFSKLIADNLASRPKSGPVISSLNTFMGTAR